LIQNVFVLMAKDSVRSMVQNEEENS